MRLRAVGVSGIWGLVVWRLWLLRFGVYGLGFRVWGLWVLRFGVYGLGSRVCGLCFRFGDQGPPAWFGAATTFRIERSVPCPTRGLWFKPENNSEFATLRTKPSWTLQPGPRRPKPYRTLPLWISRLFHTISLALHCLL